MLVPLTVTLVVETTGALPRTVAAVVVSVKVTVPVGRGRFSATLRSSAVIPSKRGHQRVLKPEVIWVAPDARVTVGVMRVDRNANRRCR